MECRQVGERDYINSLECDHTFSTVKFYVKENLLNLT